MHSESRHRAPVLRIPLSNLPPLGPGFLEARLWLPSGQSAPTEFQDLPVARLQEEAVDLGAGIKARADFQVQGGRLSVTITESREQLAPASLLTHWQVQPAPDARIEHRFYQAKVEHEFVFSEPTLLNRIRLSACLVDTEKATQWNASQWIRVP